MRERTDLNDVVVIEELALIVVLKEILNINLIIIQEIIFVELKMLQLTKEVTVFGNLDNRIVACIIEGVMIMRVVLVNKLSYLLMMHFLEEIDVDLMYDLIEVHLDLEENYPTKDDYVV